jgi:hypothetical protein
MKFIEQLTKSDLEKKSIQHVFNEKGVLTSDSEDKVFAKNLEIDIGKGEFQHQYLLRTYNNIPLDPMGPEARRDIWRRTELKQVSRQTFDYYIMYLRTKNSLYYTRAQRSFING